jgi:lipopolysaccharide export system permease protein
MNLSLTFSTYISKRFLTGVGLTLAIISCVILLSSSIEVARSTYGKEVSFSIISKLILLKYPFLIQKILPFLILLGSLFCFSQLTRSGELVIARAVGISVWQFLLPALICTIVIGLFVITVFNPFSAALLSTQERLAHKYLKGSASTVTIFNQGIWLKEKNVLGNIIIHAKSVYSKEMKLYEVNFFILDKDNNFIRRINAKSAELYKGYWNLNEASIFSANKFSEPIDNYKITTTLELGNLQDSFSSPETISFWEMPSFINSLKNAGFSAIKHSIYYYSLLIQPLLMCSMVLIAASFSLHLPRHGKLGINIIYGVMVGFTIYFFTHLISALGLAGTIPLSLAILAPVTISLLIGIALLLHYEDG